MGKTVRLCGVVLVMLAMASAFCCGEAAAWGNNTSMVMPVAAGVGNSRVGVKAESGTHESGIVGQIPEIEEKGLSDIKLKNGEEYKLFKVADSQIYYLEFASQGIQTNVFDRISVFVESAEYVGQVLDDDKLSESMSSGTTIQGIGYDFSFDDICRFLSKAEAEGVTLNARELAVMKTSLLEQGLLSKTADGYEAEVKGMLISTAQDSGFRHVTIDHEMRHGLYTTDSWTRVEVGKIWDALSADDQMKVSNAVSGIGHWDPNNRDIIVSELYACILDPTSGLSSKVVDNPLSSLPSPGVIADLEDKFFNMETRRIKSKQIKIINSPNMKERLISNLLSVPPLSTGK